MCVQHVHLIFCIYMTCKHLWMIVILWSCTYMRTYICTYCTRVSMYRCKYIHMCTVITCMCMHTHTHTHTHTHLDGVGDMSEILDYMNYKPNNAIGLKYDLLKTIYRTFEMESKVKVVFREANGFQYLVSYMSKLDRSLSAVRTLEWTLGKSECAVSGIVVWIYIGGLYCER